MLKRRKNEIICVSQAWHTTVSIFLKNHLKFTKKKKGEHKFSLMLIILLLKFIYIDNTNMQKTECTFYKYRYMM